MAVDRKSLNRAFWDLGLRFQWDEATWSALSAAPDLRTQLRQYLERHQPHLLGVYDVDFLGRIIEERLASPADARVGMEAHHSF
jgi:hypothetical protein